MEIEFNNYGFNHDFDNLVNKFESDTDYPFYLDVNGAGSAIPTLVDGNIGGSSGAVANGKVINPQVYKVLC